MGFPQGCSLLQASTSSAMESSCPREQPVSPCLSVGCREISAPAPGAPPPSPSLTLVSAVLFHLSIVPPFLWLQVLPISFFPYPVKSVIPGALPQSLVALAWPSRSRLALALSVTGEASGSFSQEPPCCQNLVMQTQETLHSLSLKSTSIIRSSQISVTSTKKNSPCQNKKHQHHNTRQNTRSSPQLECKFHTISPCFVHILCCSVDWMIEKHVEYQD